MQYDQKSIENQKTDTLSAITESCSFHDYLQHHRLLWADVAQTADVPVIVVWSIDHNLAVSFNYAERVRIALQILTGVPFTESIQIIE